ncbi:MAG: hypothetical protein WBA98_09760 [Gordonia sp. (in: high G+C Gram-positive bacteria)]|uniref:hypothetical protein n=1 Tax=Gordonia sp. (in: high G+C Gram-positive bacteria) TaxID=84139 RepID=UPI003C715BF4
MLSIALGATLVGFALLVVALVTANLGLAIACVAVCVVGLILLLVDTIRANRRGHGNVDDDPLFTIRGRESVAREEPLEASLVEDDVAGDDLADDAGDNGFDEADTENPQSGYSRDPGYPRIGQSDGLGSVVVPADEQVLGDGTPTGPNLMDPDTTESNPGGGDVNDYLRSTGSFPVQPPATAAAPVVPQAPAPAAPRFTPGPPVGSESGQQPAVQDPISGPHPTIPDQYVGRRRLADDPTDDIVVRSSDPDLPAMQFVWEDPSTTNPPNNQG